jgi:hypothetical protein
MLTIQKDPSLLIAEAIVACMLVINDNDTTDTGVRLSVGPETLGDTSALRVLDQKSGKVVWIYASPRGEDGARVFVGEHSDSTSTTGVAPLQAGIHNFTCDEYYKAARFIYDYFNV